MVAVLLELASLDPAFNSLSSNLGLMAFHKNASLPGAMTDIRVEMAVSVAMVASWRTDFEHDSIDVMENPMGLYCGLIAFRASLSLLILVKIVSGVAAAPG